MDKYYIEVMESTLIYISSTIPPHSSKLIFTSEEKQRLIQSPYSKQSMKPTYQKNSPLIVL